MLPTSAKEGPIGQAGYGKGLRVLYSTAGDRVGEGLSLRLALCSLESGHQWVRVRMQRFHVDQQRNVRTQQDPRSRSPEGPGGEGMDLLGTGVLRLPELVCRSSIQVTAVPGCGLTATDCWSPLGG